MLVVYPIPTDFFHRPDMQRYPLPFPFSGVVFKITDDEQHIVEMIQNTAHGDQCCVVLDYQDFCRRTLGNNESVDALRRLRMHAQACHTALVLAMQSADSTGSPQAKRFLVEQADEVYEYSTQRGAYISTKTRSVSRPMIEDVDHVFAQIVETRELPKLYMFKVWDYTTALVGYRNESGFYVQRGDGTCYHYENYRVKAYVELNVSVDWDQLQEPSI